MRVLLICLLLVGCATPQQKQIVAEGYQFKAGQDREQALEAIVNTLQDENLNVTTINEKFGIVSTGVQKVPAAQVLKWRGDPIFGVGETTWNVEINFNVKKDGTTRVKYCVYGPDAVSGAMSCIPYKIEESIFYFRDKIASY